MKLNYWFEARAGSDSSNQDPDISVVFTAHCRAVKGCCFDFCSGELLEVGETGFLDPEGGNDYEKHCKKRRITDYYRDVASL